MQARVARDGVIMVYWKKSSRNIWVELGGAEMDVSPDIACMPCAPGSPYALQPLKVSGHLCMLLFGTWNRCSNLRQL